MQLGVIIPAFNAADWIADAIRSVQAQSVADWRMVVVDDGSTDRTAGCVAGLADPRIRLVRQANAGVSAARNRGMAEMTADAVLFLDADDWLAPDALACLSAALAASPDAVASVGPACFVADGARSPGRRAPRPRAGDLLEPLLVRNRFANGGHVLIRGSALRAAGRFRPDLTFGEDWELWVRLALRGSFVRVPGNAPLLFVRERADGGYLRQLPDPIANRRCLDAIFGHAELNTRFSGCRLRVLRRRAEAEHAWALGRVLLEHKDPACWRWLLRSIAMEPGAKRICMLAAFGASRGIRGCIGG